jgi:hypothetical protein
MLLEEQLFADRRHGACDFIESSKSRDSAVIPVACTLTPVPRPTPRTTTRLRTRPHLIARRPG